MRPRVSIITAATRMGIDAPPLIRLLCFASPAFPTGGFAYSQGIESAVEAGDIADEQSLREWLRAVLQYGSGWSDSILLRHAFRAHADAAALAAVAEMASANCMSEERQAETLGQGHAFAASAAAWGETASVSYPVAFGVLSARQGIGEDEACLGFLVSVTGNLISAAIRLGALGQAGGLRVMQALEQTIIGVAAATRDCGLEDVGGACFLADIAAMRHETQYSRLFRS
jgi:urease accessory protein